MARIGSISVGFAVIAMMVGAPAHAAALYGSLKANFGDGFGYVAVDNGRHAPPGVSVMAVPGGSGQIVYENDCTVPVEEGRVELVHSEPPCVAQASAGGAPHKLADWAIFTLPTLVAVGGGVGLYYLIHDSDDDKPASP